MNLGTLIETHGYWVLAVGCLLEGETVLILAGFAAHRGYLNPLAVLAIATTAGFFGDQCYFWLGRWRGPAIVNKWPSIARQAERVQHLVNRYHAAVIVGIRFAYGLRIAGPILLGMASISGYRFGIFNAIGALLWACVIAGIGWVFGQAAEAAMGDIRQWEWRLILGIGVAGLIIWAIRKILVKKNDEPK